MFKKTGIFIFFPLLFFLVCVSTVYAQSQVTHTIARVPIPVKISVANDNSTTTFSICNTTTSAIPLNDIELDFNYVTQITGNISGEPSAAWRIVKNGCGPIVLLGGTQWTPALQPDPTCKKPMTVVFASNPDLPLPNGPFVFKAATDNPPPQTGKINVKLPTTPAAGTANPTVKVAGMGINQQQAVTWGSAWLVSNLVPGAYTVSGSAVDNGTDTYQSQPITANVTSGATSQVQLVYTKVSSPRGKLTVNMPAAPATGVPNPEVSVAGQGATQKQVVNWSAKWEVSNLVPGSYTVTSANVSNGTDTYQAAPITATVNASANTDANITYSRVSGGGRPASWSNIKHIVFVILENTNAGDALAQPYMKSLTTKGAYASQFFAITHPSQPNYIASVAGSTLGVTSNNNYNLDGKHLGDLFNAKGLSWKLYAEDLPNTPCFKGDSGKYDRKHNPFISFKNVQNDPVQCAKIVNASQFFSDLSAGKLPAFSYYVPNEDNNGHDTGIAYADKWLQRVFGPVLSNANVLADTLFIITFDEDDSADNKIYTVFVGAGVKVGATSSKRYDHYNGLRTIEEIFQLGNLGRNDATAAVINDLWQP